MNVIPLKVNLIFQNFNKQTNGFSIKKDASVWAINIQKDPTQSKELKKYGKALWSDQSIAPNHKISKFSRSFIRTARASPYAIFKYHSFSIT